jgi:hypothetical protein
MNCLVILSDLSTGSVGVHVRCPEGSEKVSVDDLLGGIFKAGNNLVCTATFFEVPVVSSVARLFGLRSSWKT